MAYPGTKYLDNYQILACDGSHVVYATNPNNTDDIINHTFIDAIIQPGVKTNEHAALHSMLERFEPSDLSRSQI